MLKEYRIMKLVHILAGAAMVITGGTAIARERLTPEAQLAKLTAGRVAGTPVDCINQRDIQSSQIIDGTAIAYTSNNGTIYVNRPRGGGAFLNDDNILVTKTYTGQLCSIDIVNLVDRGSRMNSGSISLDKFVPYPRPPKAPKVPKAAS